MTEDERLVSGTSSDQAERTDEFTERIYWTN